MIVLNPFQRSVASVYEGDCDRIFVNPFKWISLSQDEKSFILAHELAHCGQYAVSELEADRLGYEQHVRNGGSPKGALSALRKAGASSNRIQQIKEFMFNPIGQDVFDLPNNNSGVYFPREEITPHLQNVNTLLSGEIEKRDCLKKAAIVLIILLILLK